MGDVASLQFENSFLKEHIQRIMEELRRYQIKYPSVKISQDIQSEDNGERHWIVSPEITSPLLEAYDNRK